MKTMTGGTLMAIATAASSFTPSAAQQGTHRVDATAGRSYASTTESGNADLAAIAALPTTVSFLPLVVKPNNLKGLKGRPIAIATYGLYLIRSGEVSAYAGGFGSAMMGRRSKLRTALVGVPDELANRLAGEAYDDLAARLVAAGFRVIPYAELAARPAFATIASGGTKIDLSGQPLYAPADKPLKAGSPLFKPGSQGGWDRVGADGTLVLNPGMVINYNWLEGSGTSNYGSRASTSGRAWFSVGQPSGAFLLGNQTPPYRGTYAGWFLTEKPLGTPEPFAVMYPAKDQPESSSLASGMALAGWGTTYRQNNIYAVQADPGRYATLTRAAFQGLNAGIVAEMVRAAAK